MAACALELVWILVIQSFLKAALSKGVLKLLVSSKVLGYV